MSVAVVGCGGWGKNLVRGFHELGALNAVVERTSEGRELASTIAPGVRVVTDIDQVLEDSQVKGIVLATPAETHASLCERVLQAGRDVLCEKPLALTYRDGQRVARLAEELGCVLMVGHILEYHPAILKIRELVADDALGRLRYIYSNRLNLGKVRTEENILWSFAPHDIAVILRLMGTLPAEVIAGGATFLQPNIADVTVSQLFFSDGRSAHVFVSWLNPFKEQKLVVVGAKKMITFDDVAKELVLYDQRVDIHEGKPTPVKGQGTPVDYEKKEPLKEEARAFLHSIETRQKPITDGQSALNTLAVLDGLQQSLVRGTERISLSTVMGSPTG